MKKTIKQQQVIKADDLITKFNLVGGERLNYLIETYKNEEDHPLSVYVDVDVKDRERLIKAMKGGAFLESEGSQKSYSFIEFENHHQYCFRAIFHED